MKITLTWDCVMHDNHKHIPVVQKKRARLILSGEYREKKKRAELEIKRQYKGYPLKGEIHLHGAAYFPDRRRRDVGNYRKLITDAMSELCYGDDSQIASEIWERAGIDPDNPRIEIEITATLEAA